MSNNSFKFNKHESYSNHIRISVTAYDTILGDFAKKMLQESIDKFIPLRYHNKIKWYLYEPTQSDNYYIIGWQFTGDNK